VQSEILDFIPDGELLYNIWCVSCGNTYKAEQVVCPNCGAGRKYESDLYE